MSTNKLSKKDIKRQVVEVDAKGKVLGRLASEVAVILMGKNKVNFVPYLDSGDMVVVKNAKDVVVTGRKMKQKVYFRHSGYPGGDTRIVLEKLIVDRPTEVVRHAVYGMVPKTKLGRAMMKKLRVYAGGNV